MMPVVVVVVVVMVVAVVVMVVMRWSRAEPRSRCARTPSPTATTSRPDVSVSHG